MGKGASSFLGTAGQIAGVASPALGLGFGLASMIQSNNEKNDAEQALKNYKRQELNNVADGLQVSTLGSDLQREEQTRLASGQIEALQGGGARSLIGGLGKVQAGNNTVMQQTGANLDMQQKQLDQIRAEDQARIRAMQENREIGDINALSSQYQSGKQDKNMATGNLIQGIGSLGGALQQFGNKTANPNDTGNPYTVSGQGMIIPNTISQPQSTMNNPVSGYGNNFNFPNYQPSSFNTQQPYGIFNRYPYQNYTPQNQ